MLGVAPELLQTRRRALRAHIGTSSVTAGVVRAARTHPLATASRQLLNEAVAVGTRARGRQGRGAGRGVGPKPREVGIYISVCNPIIKMHYPIPYATSAYQKRIFISDSIKKAFQIKYQLIRTGVYNVIMT